MLRPEDIVPAADAMFDAANAVARDLGEGDVGGEEDFSGQLVGRLKGKFEDFRTDNVRWHVAAAIQERLDGDVRTSVRFSGRQLQSKGEYSEESLLGADLVLVIDIDAPDYKASKGIFVQAKRLDPGKRLPSRGLRDLHTQCKKMLDVSAASFVFLYSSGELAVISAAAVEATQRRDLHAIPTYPSRWFFQDFLICWIGDPRIEATDRESLAILRTMSHARNALLLSAKQTS